MLPSPDRLVKRASRFCHSLEFCEEEKKEEFKREACRLALETPSQVLTSLVCLGCRAQGQVDDFRRGVGAQREPVPHAIGDHQGRRGLPVEA